MDNLKNMSFSIVLFLIGAIFIFVGLSGGFVVTSNSFVIQEIWARVASAVIGTTLAVIGIWMEVKSKPIVDKSATRMAVASSDSVNGFKFSRTRAEETNFSSRIAEAKKNIFIMGGALNRTIGDSGPDLLRQAAQGCQVRLLIMNPHQIDSKSPNPIAQAMGEYYKYEGDYSHFIEQALDDLKSLLAGTSDRARNNIEVRLYNSAQTISMNIMDNDELEKTGKMRVEMLVYGGRANSRPGFELTQLHESDLFKVFNDAYAVELWQKSIPWFPVLKV